MFRALISRFRTYAVSAGFRNFCFVLGSSVIGQGVSFGIALYIANRFGARPFGIVSYAQSLQNYMVVLSTFGLSQVLARELVQNAGDRERTIAGALTVRTSMGALLFTALCAYLALAGYGGTERAVLLLYGLNALFLSVNLDQSYDALRASRYHAVIRLAGFFGCYALLTAAAVFVFRTRNYVHIVASMTAATFVFMAANVLYFRRRLLRFRFRADARFIGRLMRMGLPLLYTSLLTVVFANIGITFMRHLHGNAATGVYAAAFRVISMFLMVDVAVSRVLMPRISGLALAEPGRRVRELRRIVLLKAAYTIPFVLGVVFAAGPLVGLLYSVEFTDAAGVLRVLGLWPLALVFSPLGTFLYMNSDMKYFILYVTFQMAAAVLLNALLVGPYSYTGAAWAYSGSGIAAALLLLPLAGRSVRKMKEYTV